MMLVDFDGSGEVGFHEFIQWWQEFHLTRLFQAADREGKGQLQLEDCVGMCSAMDFTDEMMKEVHSL
jgi:hypothetical protein